MHPQVGVMGRRTDPQGPSAIADGTLRGKVKERKSRKNMAAPLGRCDLQPVRLARLYK